MKSSSTYLVLGLGLVSQVGAISSKDWAALNSTVHGRLIQRAPYARPCFQDANTTVGTFDPAECSVIQQDYLDTFDRVGQAGSYEGTQWETCPASGAQCLLDSTNPTDSAAFAPPKVCSQGSVPDYFIDVREISDIQAGFSFVKKTGVQLIIKNTGHNYQGTSARPGALALWTNNLRNISFTPSWKPTGCPAVAARPAVRLGAGVNFNDLYEFGEANNLTLPGGACATVSPSGGYVMGGGLSIVSTTAGLAADRALEFKVVVPSGQILIANQCQNTDLYFALRGGGGGTFGVVFEVVSLALPRTPVRAFVINNIPTDEATTRRFWKVVLDNTLPWANAGWSGYITSSYFQYINPLDISPEDAQAQMQPMIDFATSINQTPVQKTLDSFVEYWKEFLEPIDSGSGSPSALSSRLIPDTNFRTIQSREELLNATLAAAEGHGVTFLFATSPYKFKPDNMTSVTPAFYNSPMIIEVVDQWNFNTTASEQKKILDGLTSAVDPLRKITPNSGTYINESDQQEPNFQQSFWGNNYQRLLAIKKKYDPTHILDCWHCVGWKGKSDPNFKCYL